jgi:WD40 repeat protein
MQHGVLKLTCMAMMRSLVWEDRLTSAVCVCCCSGDHTVKIICCRTGQCLKVLLGHRRTPWVVRFHPQTPRLLASGSLDYEVCTLLGLGFFTYSISRLGLWSEEGLRLVAAQEAPARHTFRSPRVRRHHSSTAEELALVGSYCLLSSRP